jgi:hypothetical protein
MGGSEVYGFSGGAFEASLSGIISLIGIYAGV